MTISLLLRILAAASLVLSAPAGSAEEAPPPPPESQFAVAAVAETRTLIEQGRFKEALGTLRPEPCNRMLMTLQWTRCRRCR